MSKPDFVMQTFIRCTQDALWEALLDPEQITTHHFMAKRVTLDGDTYTYENPDGSTMMLIRNVRTDPKTLIEQTFEPKWEEGIGTSRTRFLIAVEGDHCGLTVEHYDLHFPLVYGEGIADGWARWASGLKTWLETGNAHAFATEEAPA